MYNIVVPQKLKTDQYLYCKTTDQLLIQPIIVVADDEFVEVAAE